MSPVRVTNGMLASAFARREYAFEGIFEALLPLPVRTGFTDHMCTGLAGSSVSVCPTVWGSMVQEIGHVDRSAPST